MILGLLSLGAVSYGLWTVMRSAFVLPVSTIVEKGINELAKTIEIETSTRYRPGEGPACAEHLIVFGEVDIFQRLAPYSEPLQKWMGKKITLTQSELEDLTEFVNALRSFENTAPWLDSTILETYQKAIVLEPTLRPILTFLEKFHPDRMEVA